MANLGISVLVIDDEKGLTTILQMYLQRFGYNASVQNDGNAAVGFYKDHQPDITLIDVLLDVDSIDGIEVLKRIREINPNAICIMMTRISDEPTVKKAKELGALHYVLKPLSGEEVVGIVNKAAETVKQRRAS